MSFLVQDRPFELIAGNHALDLVNTLDWRFRDDGPEELLASYDDLLRFSAESALLSGKQIRAILRESTQTAAADALVSCRELREAAAEIFYAAVDSKKPPASQIRVIERSLKQAREQRHLAWSGSQLSWDWPPSECAPYLPVWMLSIATARLMLSDQMHVLRACEKPDCRWLFLDTSKNHSRRWCDMKICGNRMKARRFKAQHKS